MKPAGSRRCAHVAAGFALALLAWLGAWPAWTAANGAARLVFAVEATDVTFELGAMMHTVHGSANLERGELVLDASDQTVSGEVVVDARSAETGNVKRDRKMHRKVLLSDEHPRIVLRPRSWEGELDLTGESTVTVEGVLELAGEEHEVELPVHLRRESESVVAVDFELVIPYVEWGLENPSTFVLRVEKTVTVAVSARATLAGAPSVQ